jgi:hypothetical protein
MNLPNQHTKNAGTILKRHVLFPRAVIGQAIAEYKSNNFAVAEKLLNSIIYDMKFDRISRRNAAYLLANILKNEQ